MEREIAVEAKEEVLAVRVHRPHRAALEAFRPAIHRMALLRGLDRDDLPAEEYRAHPVRGGVDRVSLRH